MHQTSLSNRDDFTDEILLNLRQMHQCKHSHQLIVGPIQNGSRQKQKLAQDVSRGREFSRGPYGEVLFHSIEFVAPDVRPETCSALLGPHAQDYGNELLAICSKGASQNGRVFSAHNRTNKREKSVKKRCPINPISADAKFNEAPQRHFDFRQLQVRPWSRNQFG